MFSVHHGLICVKIILKKVYKQKSEENITFETNIAYTIKCTLAHNHTQKHPHLYTHKHNTMDLLYATQNCE